MPRLTDEEIFEAVVLIVGSKPNKMGTGFVFREHAGEVWVLTCAHVVREVGGPEGVRIEDRRIVDDPVQVLTSLDACEVDLAVLKARLRENGTIHPLKLGLVGHKDLSCLIAGYSELDARSWSAEPLQATVGSSALLHPKDARGARFRAWKLVLSESSRIESGYSGSPVACEATGTVFAVASHSAYEGERGYAISLANLKELWRDLPPDVFAVDSRSQSGLSHSQQRFLNELFSRRTVPVRDLKRVCSHSVPPGATLRLPPLTDAVDLLDWLLDTPSQNNDRLPLYDVLAYMAERPPDRSDREEIGRIMETLVMHTPGIVTAPLVLPDERAEGETDSLQVEFWAPEKDNTCEVRVRLFRSGKLFPESIYVRDRENGGLLAVGELSHQKALVGELRGDIARYDLDVHHAIVEFILPLPLLSQGVEQWPDRVGNPLGVLVPVVVRSRERLRDPEMQAFWPNGWERLKTVIHEHIRARLWWIEDGSQGEIPDAVRDDAVERLSQGVGVVLAEVPDPEAAEDANVLFYLLYCGAPVMLWPRDSVGTTALRSELESFLDRKPFGALPWIVREMRSELRKDRHSPCHALTLLWDDPDRREKPRADDEYYRAPSGP